MLSVATQQVLGDAAAVTLGGAHGAGGRRRRGRRAGGRVLHPARVEPVGARRGRRRVDLDAAHRHRHRPGAGPAAVRDGRRRARPRSPHRGPLHARSGHRARGRSTPTTSACLRPARRPAGRGGADHPADHHRRGAARRRVPRRSSGISTSPGWRMAKPLRPRLPIWVAALRTPLVRVAGELADGLVGHPSWSIDWAMRADQRAVRRRASRAPAGRATTSRSTCGTSSPRTPTSPNRCRTPSATSPCTARSPSTSRTSPPTASAPRPVGAGRGGRRRRA